MDSSFDYVTSDRLYALYVCTYFSPHYEDCHLRPSHNESLFTYAVVESQFRGSWHENGLVGWKKCTNWNTQEKTVKSKVRSPVICRQISGDTGSKTGLICIPEASVASFPPSVFLVGPVLLLIMPITLKSTTTTTAAAPEC